MNQLLDFTCPSSENAHLNARIVSYRAYTTEVIIRYCFLPILCLCGWLLIGCSSTAPLPDLTPYAEAGQQLESSVSESFTAAQRSMERQALVLTDAAKRPHNADVASSLNTFADEYKALANATKELAKSRLDALAALAAYTDRLAEIAKSSEEQAEKVAETADAVEGVVSKISSLLPLSFLNDDVVGSLSDMYKRARQNTLRVRASKRIEDAVNASDESIELLAEALSIELTALDEMYQSRRPSVRATHLLREQSLFNFYEELQNTRRMLAGHLRDTLSSPIFASNVAAGIWNEPPAFRAMLTVNEQLRQAEVWHAPLMAEISQAEASIEAGQDLIVATRRALKRWQQVHGDLGPALRAGRQPSLRSLSASIEEIERLVSAIRALR